MTTIVTCQDREKHVIDAASISAMRCEHDISTLGKEVFEVRVRIHIFLQGGQALILHYNNEQQLRDDDYRKLREAMVLSRTCVGEMKP